MTNTLEGSGGAGKTVEPTSPRRGFEEIVIGGQRIAVASRLELTTAMVSDCLTRRRRADNRNPVFVYDTNGHALSLRARDPAYRDALDRGDIVHADGQFLIPASHLLAGKRIPERSPVTDLIHDFSAAADSNGLRFYFLGGSEGLLSRFIAVMHDRYPGLEIVGSHHGYFRQEEEPAVIADINRSNADVVWVGLGKPKEVLFCDRYRNAIRAGWVVTAGGCYNYVTGDYKRAPKWMQRAGLEWLYRMASNPRQLFWRYIVTTPHAIFLVLTRTKRAGSG